MIKVKVCRDQNEAYIEEANASREVVFHTVILKNNHGKKLLLFHIAMIKMKLRL